MRRSRRVAAVSLTVLVASLACNDSTGPLAACTGPVELVVTSGLSPEFRWSPACGAQALLVDPTPPSQGFGLRWGLAAADRLVEPPVRYGEEQPGTQETGFGAPLEPGREYTVHLLGESSTLATVRRTP